MSSHTITGKTRHWSTTGVTAMTTKTLNVRLPEELLDWIDSLVDNRIYNSRSEVIRSLLREFVQE